MTFTHVYADESRQESPRFILYGMLLIPRGAAEKALLQSYAQLRQKHQWGTGEFKWNKVSNYKLSVYQEFVDIFFAHPKAEFRCLVVDKQKVNYAASHQGDHEAAFYEFYFQALTLNLSREHEYLVFIDQRNNRQSNRLTDLKAKINADWLTKGATDNIVRNLEPRESKKLDLLQITDVLLGAVGYDVEERVESPPKVAMVQHIAQQIGVSRLREHQGRGTRFQIGLFPSPEEPLEP